MTKIGEVRAGFDAICGICGGVLPPLCAKNASPSTLTAGVGVDWRNRLDP